MNGNDRFLGNPILFSGSKVKDFNFLVEKMARRIEGWKSKLLSQAGRLTLIQSVASSTLEKYVASFNPRIQECGIPVNSLLSSDTSSWRPEMVRRLFCPALSDMVWSFPRLFPNLPNELIWKASKDGSFSFKEAYLALVRGWCGEEDDMWRLIWKIDFNRFLVMTPPAPFASRMRTPPTTYSSIAKLPRRFGDLALGEFVLMLWFFLTTRLLYDGSYLRQTFLLLMQRTGQGSSCMLLWCAFIFGGVVEDNRSHTPAGVDLVSGSNTRQHTWNDINLFMDAAVRGRSGIMTLIAFDSAG
uniref:Uncharacterized protein n=1 Tax=Cannabis sativa TaxID=3483 RepID=A0A803NIS9_CANSA